MLSPPTTYYNNVNVHGRLSTKILAKDDVTTWEDVAEGLKHAALRLHREPDWLRVHYGPGVGIFRPITPYLVPGCVIVPWVAGGASLSRLWSVADQMTNIESHSGENTNAPLKKE